MNSAVRYLTRTALLLTSCCLIGPGCDRSPQNGTPAVNDKAAATRPSSDNPASTRPTTQQLVEGRQKTITLTGMPLSIEVPESWKLTSPGAGAWLEGPAPHCDIQIQLSTQPTIFTAQTLTLMEQQRQKEAAQSGSGVEMMPVRVIGSGARLLEQRETRDGTVVDADGKMVNTKIMDWTIEVYVPSDKNFTLNILHFAMLRADDYQKDKDFLTKIISTIHYDAAKGLLRP